LLSEKKRDGHSSMAENGYYDSPMKNSLSNNAVRRTRKKAGTAEVSDKQAGENSLFRLPKERCVFWLLEVASQQ
jgi:hypothetical protein